MVQGSVDLSSVINGIKAKLKAERDDISRRLASLDTMRDFGGLAERVLGLQASVRAIDILTGRVDLNGNPIREEVKKPDPVPDSPVESELRSD